MASESTGTKRSEFTEEQGGVLKRFYNEGMNSVKHHEKIEECARETRLDPQQIKNFIGNFRRKVKGTSTSGTKKQPKLQGPNAFSYFVSKVPRGSQDRASYFKQCAQKWKEMATEEKNKYSEAAEKLRQDPTMGMTKEDLITHHQRSICSSVEALEKLNYHVGGLGIDTEGGQPPLVFGSDRVFNFFKPLTSHFEGTLRGIASMPVNPKEKGKLKMEVRQLFKDLWCKAAGKRERVPYGEIEASKTVVSVNGLPDGVVFKDPSNYSKGQLVAVLKHAEKLSLKIEKRPIPAVVPPVPATVTNEEGLETVSVVQQPVTKNNSEVVIVQQPEKEADNSINISFLELQPGRELAEEIVNQISQEPGLLQDVMTTNEADSIEKVIELKQEVKEEHPTGGKTMKRKKKGMAKNFTRKKKTKMDSYTVERITGIKINDGKRLFKIKWLHSEQQTWEPEENILDQGLIESYLHELNH